MMKTLTLATVGFACLAVAYSEAGRVQPAATVATPTFSPSPGTYDSSLSVTISCATAGATIHYTTHGQDPTRLREALPHAPGGPSPDS
jgi:Chitobiase/beta-hexosaminidase C-terminal domain